MNSVEGVTQYVYCWKIQNAYNLFVRASVTQCRIPSLWIFLHPSLVQLKIFLSVYIFSETVCDTGATFKSFQKNHTSDDKC
jgi:hypothetical protein